jgi:hypothetical protein
MESWIRIETGQLEQAAVLAAGLSDLAERHGLDFGQLLANSANITVSVLAALGADHDLTTHISTMTALVDTWRKLEVNA